MRLGTPPRVEQRFAFLVNAITSQQLSGKAAATIWVRVQGVIGDPVTAASVAEVPIQLLRDAGMSEAKAASVKDLAHAVLEQRIDLTRVGYLHDDHIISQLTAVRGIGPWTAQMFLMFSLRRLDVWPTGDYGVRTGYARAYRLLATPNATELERLGDRFRPFRSVAAWYCWRAADDPESKF